MQGILQVTHEASVACLDYMGLGDRDAVDQAAVSAMREAFQKISIRGQIVIGEGERDSAPMLYIGEKVGRAQDSDPEYDIAVDPLEGTNFCAKATAGALSVLALAKKGSLFNAPDIYMKKLACGPAAKEVIDLNKSAEDNIKSVAQVLNKPVSEIKVAILDRDRHQNLIKSVYDLGARVLLIEDGDLSASIFTSWGEKPVDLMMGIGGAPEGVLSAAALKCLGGGFQGQLVYKNEEEKKRATNMGIKDKVYQRDELVKSSVIFCATGVTSGELLKGVRRRVTEVETESLYMDSESGECFKICKTVKV